MPYKINYEAFSNNFALPKEIIDDNFDSLNPIYLKAIILIYNNSYKYLSANLISNLLKVEENIVREAINYWIGKGLLIGSEKPSIKKEAVVLPKTAANPIPQSRELSFLLECVEGKFKRPLSTVEYKSIVHILEFIRLPADVILMAVEYCISINKANFSYIEKVCINWAEKGIINHDIAEQYLSLLKQTQQNETKIKQLFGIQNRNLTEYESKLIMTWINEYKFSIEVIKIAFEKTVAATNKVAFAYMNKILSNWYQSGFKTIEDIQNSDIKRNSVQEKSSSYNIDDLDKFWDIVPKLN